MNIKNGTLSLSGSTMDYIRFGRGDRVFVMLPGLGDGLKNAAGMALPLAWMYRRFARDFRVLVLSRAVPLKDGSTTADMAEDVACALRQLGVERASVVGVSMGGMIAQWLAIDYPEKVNKLILTVTCARPNPILTESVEEWIRLAKEGDAAGFMDSNLRRIYSDDYYRKNKWMVPLTGLLTRPKSYDRFLIMAEACRTHDARTRLAQITAPTLVIGGEQDQSLGGEASREIAAQIPGAQLKIYPQWGHGLYEEAKDFNQLVLDFLMK